MKRGPYKVGPAGRRFWHKVNPFGPVSEYVPTLGRCWEWTAAKDGRGYGRFGPTHGRTVLAHRYAFEMFVGPIPDGFTIDHLCFNPSCVNPRHLDAVRGPENSRRAGAAGRMAFRWNSGWTHCSHGHEYTEANTRRDARGRRHCRTCDRTRQETRSENRRQTRIAKYGYDPGPRARFDPASAVRP